MLTSSLAADELVRLYRQRSGEAAPLGGSGDPLKESSGGAQYDIRKVSYKMEEPQWD